jgi:hypothetical protein
MCVYAVEWLGQRGDGVLDHIIVMSHWVVMLPWSYIIRLPVHADYIQDLGTRDTG